ncbi:MerR family transcriptional regulator [[Clostridium] fimetarium]|uniref:DNA-binding transcriptional regulator, MerR family n=1 Tax=[Clostridium] fimetarium TaxID=99656 RepID=A0A1I0NGH2_9FIRM|nr:MerR family transcriptional regulator [[Clostridium] fimetarium]SEW00372.1 DNA-binding transcriptional regulator, MerR family [[Clostridium] fimetarium]
MTIGEISRVTYISEYTLRYYEKKELIRVERDARGRRLYTDDDIEWIKFIKKLKDTGMLLRNIKKYSDLRYMGNSTINERMEILEKHRIVVLEEQRKWYEYLNNLDVKIEIYRNELLLGVLKDEVDFAK